MGGYFTAAFKPPPRLRTGLPGPCNAMATSVGQPAGKKNPLTSLCHTGKRRATGSGVPGPPKQPPDWQAQPAAAARYSHDMHCCALCNPAFRMTMRDNGGAEVNTKARPYLCATCTQQRWW